MKTVRGRFAVIDTDEGDTDKPVEENRNGADEKVDLVIRGVSHRKCWGTRVEKGCVWFAT